MVFDFYVNTREELENHKGDFWIVGKPSLKSRGEVEIENIGMFIQYGYKEFEHEYDPMRFATFSSGTSLSLVDFHVISNQKYNMWFLTTSEENANKVKEMIEGMQASEYSEFDYIFN